MVKSESDFIQILKILFENDVEYIVVGGVCAVLHGAPVTTFDIDIVHNRSNENISRILIAFNELEAFVRGRGEQKRIPDETYLKTSGHLLLMTKYGPLDILGSIGKNHDYKDLFENTEEISIENMKIKILDLKTLIHVKEEVLREKDRYILPILRKVLEVSKR